MAKSVTAFIRSKNIPQLPWPSNSPDMNPIENLWMIVKRRIAQCKPSKVMLIEALIDVWA
jgi:transposase